MNITDWIVYEDDAFIAFNKPAMLPTQPDLTGDVSLLDLTDNYLGSKTFLLHRIDRPTSGIVLFAKNGEAAAAISQQVAHHRKAVAQKAKGSTVCSLSQRIAERCSSRKLGATQIIVWVSSPAR